MCASSYSSSTQIAKNIFLVFFFFFFFRRAHFFGVCTRWRNTKARDRRNGNFHGYDVQSYSALAPTALLFLSNLSSSSSLASACDNNIGVFFLLLRSLVVSSSGIVSHVTQQSAAINIRIHWETFSSSRTSSVIRHVTRVDKLRLSELSFISATRHGDDVMMTLSSELALEAGQSMTTCVVDFIH